MGSFPDSTVGALFSSTAHRAQVQAETATQKKSQNVRVQKGLGGPPAQCRHFTDEKIEVGREGGTSLPQSWAGSPSPPDSSLWVLTPTFYCHCSVHVLTASVTPSELKCIPYKTTSVLLHGAEHLLEIGDSKKTASK